MLQYCTMHLLAIQYINYISVKIVNFIYNFIRMSIIMLYLRYKEKNNQLGKKIFHLQNTEYKLI